MKKRGKFHAWGSNKLKNYHRRYSDYQVMVRAEIARQASLRKRSDAELAFEQILKDLGVKYETEKIFQNGDRHVRCDFLVGTIAFEIDGAQHQLQEEYDTGRTEWLNGKGIKTIRFQNPEVIKTPEIVIEKLKEILADALPCVHPERQASDPEGTGPEHDQSSHDTEDYEGT